MTEVRKRALTASYAFLGAVLVVVVVGTLFQSVAPPTIARGVAGVRSTALAASLVLVVSLVVGLGASALSALGPPTFDLILARLVEVAGALPTVVVVAVFASIARTQSLIVLGAILALKRGLESAKVARAELLQLAAEDFVTAARAAGIGQARLFRRHFLPHIGPAALARSTLGAAAVVSLDAAGSFLGMFPGGGTWGTILAEAVRRASAALLVGPVVATATTVAALAVISDALADRRRLGRRLVP